ncbi:MAG: DUF1501 domain-containing protein [Taibaiella sp.]|nr:DUF1501 domain-containing protein [Taibaiella sp.]
MTISRRRFLQLSSLASASMFVPKFLRAFENKPLPGNKKLIVIQLSGGNDGLNTVIPYRNDIYYSSRPLIGIKKEEALSLTDEIGLNPSLKGIKQLFDEGYVSIINGVGYARPNRSHFRSMDIWQSGSASEELVTTGWLGRYLDDAALNPDSHNSLALEVDDSLSLAMKGKDKSALAIRDINQFHNAATNTYFTRMAAHNEEHKEQLADYLYKTLRGTVSAADYIYKQSKIYTSSQTYPNTEIGKHMQIIGSLIASRAETRVYYVSHGSFDTHVNQKDRQNKLFAQLDEALTALVADLKKNDCFNDVVIMTFSEFGRRVGQNASNGTDHGTANSMFLMSGSLKKQGIYNPIPSLQDLDSGDLKYEIDFKEVYATILGKWLDADPYNILGKRYEPLAFI